LFALQLVAVTEGQGRIEWRSGKKTVLPGDVFLLQPGVWHRYRPDPAIGWTEQWIEFRGPSVDAWLQAGLLEFSLLNLRENRGFWERFEDLHRLCGERPLGYRAIAGGIGLTLLAEAVASAEQAANPKKTALPDLVRAARGHLMEGQEVEEVAKRLGVSYQSLYRHFKQATGLSPKDYANQMRRARGEELLAGTDLSVKEIAARLGYHSASHFSLEFKSLHGVSPSRWRDRAGGH
jgi:AraC-like DNA-binding protein